jgi:site-specific DNA recombinase
MVEKHLFTNTFYCADCGIHYKAISKDYICGSYNTHGSKACSNHLTRVSTLCLVISNDIKNLAYSLGSFSYLEKIEGIVQKQQLQSKKHINSTNEKIIALKSKKQKAVGFLVEEVISKQIHILTINFQELETYLHTKDDETSHTS